MKHLGILCEMRCEGSERGNVLSWSYGKEKVCVNSHIPHADTIQTSV